MSQTRAAVRERRASVPPRYMGSRVVLPLTPEAKQGRRVWVTFLRRLVHR